MRCREQKRKKKEFKNLLHYLIPEKNSIIDVSCGDNSDVFEIASKMDFKTIVGNDISINYFKEMKSKVDDYENLLGNYLGFLKTQLTEAVTLVKDNSEEQQEEETPIYV